MTAQLRPPAPVTPAATRPGVRFHDLAALPAQLPRLEAYLVGGGPLMPLSRHPAWLAVLHKAMRHTPYCLEAVEGGRTRGFLALADVRSLLFGRFLVSLPYVNYGGVVADDEATTRLLLDHGARLADRLGVRYLELRHEHPAAHPDLNEARTDKAHLRLDLPATAGRLWDALDAKVRNQVRKGQKSGLSAAWGGHDLLDAFYAVFSVNMRDLGTPVYGKALFAAILEQFPGRAELCVVRAGAVPVAGALLLHGWGVTEVPSASSLRRHNKLCANMLLYWHLLERAVQRGQDVFDFGRSSKGGPTEKFKSQWGATPSDACWQYYARTGGAGELRNDNPRYRRLIRLWQRLPVAVTRWVGPALVRGIP